MKKYFFTFIVILILCITCSCGYDDSQTDYSSTVQPSNTSENTIMIEEQLYEKITDSLNVRISYPKITNGQKYFVEQTNAILKEAAINNYYEKWQLDGLGLEQTYALEKQDNEYLSVVFYGLGFVVGAAHPNASCHAVTINLKTAEISALSNFVTSYELIENSIKDGKYEILYGGLKAYALDGLLNAVHNKFETLPIDQNEQKFYIAEDGSICIIIDLPHSGGDYSIIKIDLF